MENQKKVSLSTRIREVATTAFVVPARKAGKHTVTIAIREMMAKFPVSEAKGNQSVFCSALEAKYFMEPNGLRLERRDGPPSGRGTSTVFHFGWNEAAASVIKQERRRISRTEAEKMADAYLSPLRGLLAKEIAAFGGTEAYMRWVRSDEPTA